MTNADSTSSSDSTSSPDSATGAEAGHISATVRWRRSRRSRRWRFVGISSALVLVALMEFFAFVQPPSDQPAPSEVVVVLGGNAWLNRLRAGQALASQRPGSLLLLSLQDPTVCPWQQYSGDVQVICFRANPPTTQGEARYVASIAARRGAHTVAVIASADQMLRAKVRFRRCFGGELRMIESSAPTASVLKMLPYQNAAMFKALVIERSC